MPLAVQNHHFLLILLFMYLSTGNTKTGVPDTETKKFLKIDKKNMIIKINQKNFENNE